MTAEMSGPDRLESVIRLELPDRVPVGGWLDAFCPSVAGITLEEWVFDPDKAERAFHFCSEAMGGFDVSHRPPPGGPLDFITAWPTRISLPGRDLPSNAIWQTHEDELMAVEDYDFIVGEGFGAYQKVYWERIGVVPEAEEIRRTAGRLAGNCARCRKVGVEPILATPAVGIPYNFFSFGRSLNGFLMDLHRCPEKVLAASDAACDGMIAKAIDNVNRSPVRRAMIGGARAAADFISPRMAEKFFIPYMLKATRAMLDAGITPVLHLDNNFGPLLRHLLDLPKGKCLLQLDGTTDIFEAKDSLGGRMAIMGDVPATLLTLGTPEEVTAYCRRLIEVVGKDGGFVLGAGCTVPPDAKPENVAAMVSAAKHYGRY